MQLGTRAVVLSAKNLEDHDRLVTLLTEDLGVVTAYAKGARRQKGTMARPPSSSPIPPFSSSKTGRSSLLTGRRRRPSSLPSGRTWIG